MEASWLSLIMIYGNSSCCGYDRDTSSTTEFENNFKKCGFTICYLWFVKLFICVKFYTKGERVLQLCYATCYNIITNALRHYDFISVPPQLELRLGPAVNPRDLEEGDDVYFEWGDDGDGDLFFEWEEDEKWGRWDEDIDYNDDNCINWMHISLQVSHSSPPTCL